MVHLQHQGAAGADLGLRAGIQGGGPRVGRAVAPGRAQSQALVQGQCGNGEGSVERPG